MGTAAFARGAVIDSKQVLASLERVLASEEFRSAPRQQAFLRFVVTEALAGRGDEVKETLIATCVYERPANYDPHVDSTVRVEASKLRQRLARYYEGAGLADAIRISIPRGSYVPVFESVVEIRPKAPPWLWLLLTGIGGSAVLLFLFNRSPDVDGIGMKLTQLTEAASYSSGVAARPDLDFIVYASDRAADTLNLWRQPLRGGSPQRLTASPFAHETPALSMDGSLIVFRTSGFGGGLATIPSSGGEVRLIRDSAGGMNPRFAPRDTRIAFWVPRDQETREYGRVLVVDVQPNTGFGPVRLFGDFAHAATPVWSESGRHVAALGTWHSEIPEKEYDAWVIELDDRHPRGTPVKTGLIPLLKELGIYSRLTERAAIELGDWRGEWLYFTAPAGEAKDLYRIRLREDSARVDGKPERITFGAGNLFTPRLTANGGVAFARAGVSYDLYSLAVPKRGELAGDLRRHTSENGLRLRPSLDRDARRGVWETRTPASDGQLLFFDLKTGARRLFSKEDGQVYSHTAISPDGNQVAFRVLEPGFQPIYLQDLDGGEPRKVCANCGTPADWTADGKYVVYITGGQPAIIGILEVASGKYRDLIHHPSYSLFGARARLDAKGDGWVLLYADNGPRTRQIFMVPMGGYEPGAQKDWVAVTDGAAWEQSPAWSEDGKTIYYVVRHGGHACLMARQLGGTPWEVYHFHSPRQTLMRSLTNRGADSLWVLNGRIYFTLDDRTSELWHLGR